MMDENQIRSILSSNLTLTRFIKKNLKKSLKDIGFSQRLITDLVADLSKIDVQSFQQKHSEELKSVYAIGFFRKLVPDYFQKYVLPEIDTKGILLDIGCGQGVLAKRIAGKMKIKKIIGIDIIRYPEWKDFESNNIEFRVVKEKNFENFINSLKIDQIVLTWTLHHIEYDAQIRYLKMLCNSISKNKKIIILEDSFSETQKPLEGADKCKEFVKLSIDKRKKVMAIYDWVANRILAQRHKIPLPFTFRSLEEWSILLKRIGFTTVRRKFIGFPKKRDINTPQSLLVGIK